MKALFVVLGFFVAGFALGSIGPEPYPALMLPAFHGPEQTEEGDLVYLTFEVTVHFTDGSEDRIHQSTLFSPFPTSFSTTMLAQLTAFLPEPAPPTSTRWAAIFPGLDSRLVRRARTRTDPSLLNWLEGQLRTAFPARQPRSMLIAWYGNTIEPWANQSHAKEPLGELQISFPQ